MKFIKKSLTKDFNTKCQELEIQTIQAQFKKSKKKSFHLDSLSSYRSFNDSNISADLFLDHNFKAEDVSLLFFLKYLVPNIFSSLINVLISSSEVHFLGKTKDIILYDGVGLGSMYMLCFIYYLGSVFSENINISNLRNYVEKDIKNLIRNTYCARILCTLYFIFILLFTFFFFDKIIYILLGNITYRSTAKQYIWFTSPAYLMTLHYNIYCKYAGSQLIYKPILIGFIISVIFYPTLSVIFIYKLNLKIYGVSLLMNLTELVKISIMIVYFWLWDPNKQVTVLFKWRKISKRVIKLLRISLKKTYLNFSENIGFLLSNTNAALKGEVVYAKQIVFSKISNINFFLYNSFLNTVSIIIKNYLKENLLQQFRKTLIYSIFIAFLLEIILIIFISQYSLSLIKFFSEHELVHTGEYVDSLLKYVFIYMSLDLLQSILFGVLLGLKSEKQPIICSGIIFLLIQPILSYFFLEILKQGLELLWISNSVCLLLVNIIYIYTLWVLNYDDLFEDKTKSEESLYFNGKKERKFLSTEEINRTKHN